MNHTKLLTLGYHLMKDKLELEEWQFPMILTALFDNRKCGYAGCALGEGWLIGLFPYFKRDRDVSISYALINDLDITFNQSHMLFCPKNNYLEGSFLPSNATPQQVGRNIIDFVKQDLKYCEDDWTEIL